MKPTLRQLIAFTALARTEHFGRAADLLHLSQPTVSNEIKSLERALGVTLFARSRSGTTLTDAGTALLPYASNVVVAAEALEEEAHRRRDGSALRVRLAVTPSLINRLIPAVLQQIVQADGTSPVEVFETPTGGVAQALAIGHADIGVGHFIGKPHGTAGQVIGHDELWVLSGRNVLETGTSIRISELQGKKLLIWPREQNPEYFDFLLETCRRDGLQPQIVDSGVRIAGAQSFLLTTGQAFSIVPEDFAREAPQSLSCAPLDPPTTLPLQAVWRTPPVPGTDRLLRALQEQHAKRRRRR